MQQVSDNHLHIETSSLQEMHKGDQIKTFWVKSCSQLDVLNKKRCIPIPLTENHPKDNFDNKSLRYGIVVLKIKQ